MTEPAAPAEVLTPAEPTTPPTPEAAAAPPEEAVALAAPPTETPAPAEPMADAPAPGGAAPAAPEKDKPGFNVPLDLSRIAQDLQIRKAQVEQVVELFEKGFAIPFLACYRKEQTGGLHEEQLRQIHKRLQAQKQLVDRKQAILRNLQSQGRLGDELRDAILHADHHKRLEDLYLPFKPKKKSAAGTAREKGLEPLAIAIWSCDPAVANLAEMWPTFVNPEKQLATVEDVQAGVKLLLAEALADQAPARDAARRFLNEHAKLTAAKHANLQEGQGNEFREYFGFSDSLRHLVPHRISTIFRGEKQNALTVKLDFPADKLLERVVEKLPVAAHPHAELLKAAIPDAVTQFLVPALEREIRRDLADRAEEHAAGVVAKNLRRLLLQPPLPNTRVLAIDPGFRAGCRIAVLDEAGGLLDSAVVHPFPALDRKEMKKGKGAKAADAPAPAAAEAAPAATEAPAAPDAPAADAAPAPEAAAATETPTTDAPVAPAAESSTPALAAPPAPTPEQKRAEAKATIAELAKKHNVQVVALGNGPGSRECEELLTEIISELVPELAYHVVPEQGATAYALSPLGREEFPGVDGPVRAAISLGRRLQDPLRELVKMDPVQLGLGYAHHDLPEKRVRETLAAVVESTVNEVGLDANAATVPLLKHIAGMNPLRATTFIQHRPPTGGYQSRDEFKDIPGMTELAWQQSVGFLRLPAAGNPLDRTWLHPEQYETATKVLESLGATPADLLDEAKLELLRGKFAELDLAAEAAKYNLAPEALDDMLRCLARPGKDIRADQPPPLLKKKQLRVEDLQAGMELRGTVLNVVDFGAFIDVGLKDNGLVHISQLANRFIKSPYDVVFVGDVVTVWVMQLDPEKRRVSLTMIQPGTPRHADQRRSGPPPRGERPQRQGDRPPRKEPRFGAQIAMPGRPSGPMPNVQHDGGGRRPDQRRQVQYTPKPQAPKKDKPLPKLSQDALKGKSALRTFGELKALYVAKKPEDLPKPAEAPPTVTEAPPAAPTPEAPPA